LNAQISAEKMTDEILKWTQHHRVLALHAKQYRIDKICS
jgi:hypothetical protein